MPRYRVNIWKQVREPDWANLPNIDYALLTARQKGQKLFKRCVFKARDMWEAIEEASKRCPKDGEQYWIGFPIKIN